VKTHFTNDLGADLLDCVDVGRSDMAQQLILKRVLRAGPSGEWNKADYDVVADGIVVKAAAVPVGMSWMWTLGFGHHEESSADAWLRGKSDQPWPRADSVSKVKLILETPSQETPGARFAFYMPDFGISSYSRPPTTPAYERWR
jgi:hypothetical protein